MANLPYFRFFTNNWLGSSKVAMMDDAEKGVYISLLVVAWGFPDVTLPADPEVCRRLIGSKRVARVKRVLELCFERNENGWRNERERNENDHATSLHAAAVVGGKASANKRIQSTTVQQSFNDRSTNQNQNQNQNQNYITTDKVKGVVDKTQKPRFVPPSEEQVQKYCEERKNLVDPKLWIDHYTSNGWKVGKNPMKDWKAAVRTWERRKDGLQISSRGGSGESPKQRRIREACEETERRLGILPRGSKIPLVVHSSRDEPGRSGTVGETVIDGTCVEVKTS